MISIFYNLLTDLTCVVKENSRRLMTSTLCTPLMKRFATLTLCTPVRTSQNCNSMYPNACRKRFFVFNTRLVKMSSNFNSLQQCTVSGKPVWPEIDYSIVDTCRCQWIHLNECVSSGWRHSSEIRGCTCIYAFRVCARPSRYAPVLWGYTPFKCFTPVAFIFPSSASLVG